MRWVAIIWVGSQTEWLVMEKNEIVSEVVRVLKVEGQAIQECAERLQNSSNLSLEKAIGFFQDTLQKGGKIIVTGIGKSGKVAQKTAATLSSTGSLAVYLHPTEGLHGDLGLVQPHDVVLAFSYTGNTSELIRLLPSLKKLGVRIVGLGGNALSKLAQECDAWIDAEVKNEACPHNLAPTTSTTLALALGDAIAITLMQLRGFDAQLFAQNHPGGSLGGRLSLKVEDLMHRGDEVPVVSPQAPMEEVVIQSTQKKLGAVLVVEGGILLGIITDGDLRRSLRHKEAFFLLKASEVMTAKPITANSEMMAHAALRLMEDRPSQISILPVTNELGEWKGLVRLHDLVRAF